LLATSYIHLQAEYIFHACFHILSVVSMKYED
jgi:hypothetical protein